MSVLLPTSEERHLVAACKPRLAWRSCLDYCSGRTEPCLLIADSRSKRREVGGKGEKTPAVLLLPILDARIWRHLQKTTRLQLIYGVFSIRIANEGVKIRLRGIFNACSI